MGHFWAVFKVSVCKYVKCRYTFRAERYCAVLPSLAWVCGVTPHPGAAAWVPAEGVGALGGVTRVRPILRDVGVSFCDTCFWDSVERWQNHLFELAAHFLVGFVTNALLDYSLQYICQRAAILFIYHARESSLVPAGFLAAQFCQKT